MLGNRANLLAHLSEWLRENERYRDFLTIIAIHLVNYRFMVLHNDRSLEFERRRHLSRFFREFLFH